MTPWSKMRHELQTALIITQLTLLQQEVEITLPVSLHLPIDTSKKQEILQTINLKDRAEKVLTFLESQGLILS